MNVEHVAEDIRDAINLLVVFEKEYNLPQDAVKQLREKLEKIAQDLTKL